MSYKVPVVVFGPNGNGYMNKMAAIACNIHAGCRVIFKFLKDNQVELIRSDIYGEGLLVSDVSGGLKFRVPEKMKHSIKTVYEVTIKSEIKQQLDLVKELENKLAREKIKLRNLRKYENQNRNLAPALGNTPGGRNIKEE